MEKAKKKYLDFRLGPLVSSVKFIGCGGIAGGGERGFGRFDALRSMPIISTWTYACAGEVDVRLRGKNIFIDLICI